MIENLELDERWDVLSVDMNEPDSDAICSLSESEAISASRQPFQTTPYQDESAFMLRQERNYGWRYKVTLPEEMEKCRHTWLENCEISNWEYTQCTWCKMRTKQRMRIHCTTCKATACPMCAKFDCDREITPQPAAKRPYPWEDQENLLRELRKKNLYLEAEVEKQRMEIRLLKETLAKTREEFLALSLAADEKDLRGKGPTSDSLPYRGEPRKEGGHEESSKGWILEDAEEESDEGAKMLVEELALKTQPAEHDGPKLEKVVNPKKGVLKRLYKMKVTFDVPGIRRFEVQAILDTGATACCLDTKAVPEEAQEQNSYVTYFAGVNSRQPSYKPIKGRQMEIEGHRFRIPLVYIFNMDSTGDGIQMLIGSNFIRAMSGGLRIENETVTFYKNITTIQTPQHAYAHLAIVEELEMDHEEYMEIQEAVYFNIGLQSPVFKERFSSLLTRLQEQAFIGEKPLRHWSRNEIRCKIHIINPDITIEDKPRKHVTPALKEAFGRHIDALLKIGVIRPSKSRHRTMAMIVQSGSMVDPKRGEETRGKEGMVFNYRTLNDKTYKDQYSLPGINTILQKVGRSKVYSLTLRALSTR